MSTIDALKKIAADATFTEGHLRCFTCNIDQSVTSTVAKWKAIDGLKEAGKTFTNGGVKWKSDGLFVIAGGPIHGKRDSVLHPVLYYVEPVKVPKDDKIPSYGPQGEARKAYFAKVRASMKKPPASA